MTWNPMIERQVIPGGSHEDAIAHLFPIVRLLMERGHPPIRGDVELGFCPRPDGWECALLNPITAEDWAAVNDRFALPDSIVYHHPNLIRDNANWVDIIGARTSDGERQP